MTMSRAVLAAVFAIGVLAAVLLLRPSWQVTAGGENCEIRLERIVDLKSDRVGWGPTVLIDDAIFHGQFDEVYEFGIDGAFRRVVAREGAGPGEIRDVRALVRTGPRELAMIGWGSVTRVQLDDSTSVTRLLQVSPNGLEKTVALPDGSIVVMSDMNVRGGDIALAGRVPMARVDREGTITTLFGRDERETEPPLRGIMIDRAPAYHPVHGIAAVKTVKAHIELWNLDGTRRDVWYRDVPWFSWPPETGLTRQQVAAHVSGPRPPADRFMAAQFDSAGLLWVVAQDEAADWRSGIDDDGEIIDLEKWTDTVIEVLDVEGRQVVCSARVDPYIMGFAAPGVMTSYRYDRNDNPILTLWRATLTL
ncbi:MAG TPA: hypothetical protein VK928_04140 [Longimicrobiales bacterium]|nr:hypothetical protein [Longimicrobiales bacterium]